MRKKKIIPLVVVFILFFIFGIYLLNQNFDNNISKIIKDKTPSKIKLFLKNTVFLIPNLIREKEVMKDQLHILNEKFEKSDAEKKYYENIYKAGNNFEKEISIAPDKFKLNYYVAPFYTDEIFNNKKNGYLELYGDNIIIAFTSGKIIFVDKLMLIQNKDFKFINVDNNLSQLKLYNPDEKRIKWTGIKDIKVFNNYLLASVTEEIKKNCYATSLLYAKLSNEFLEFKHLFRSNECVDKDEGKSKQPFKFFNGYQTGGRIITQGNDIYLTIGDYNSWELPQSDKSLFGKLIKVNFDTKKINIISKGHRNSQGLAIFDDDNLIFTDHGPQGGDEVNIIDLQIKSIKNYGWPLASYGDHYPVIPISNYTKKIAPLLKSHKEHGFEEPIYYFDKSIGISEIIKNHYSENSYYITSLKNKTIYNLKIGENFKNSKIQSQINVGERIRDIIFDKKENLYFLYLESVPSLLVLQKN